MTDSPTYTAFHGQTLIASGTLDTVLPPVKAIFDQDPGSPLFLFDDETCRQVDFDLRGLLPEVLRRAKPARVQAGPGRPKLGVISREISLLPRHWMWLEQQPNGASAALRRIIDEARNREPEKQRARQAKDKAGRFLTAMAGDFPGYEEATRALYAGDRDRFTGVIQDWPADIRAHIEGLVEAAF